MSRQLKNCPSCGASLIPASAEFKTVRELGGLTQREMGELLGVKGSHVAYLENNLRVPSGGLILRFRAVQKKLIAAASNKIKQMEAQLPRDRATGD
jgi:transcriptional regulator with XRE-family HTH domain